MSSELTAQRDPDEAYLVFKRRGATGIPDLKIGEKLTITSVESPGHTIVAEVTTPRDLVLSGDLPASDLYSLFSLYPQYVSALSQQGDRQNFVILARDPDGRELALTPSVLIQIVLPIVTALASVQKILFGSEPTVRGITQNTPVNISLEGAGSLYEKIATDVIPWRRKRAKQIAAVDAAQRRAELEQKRAEVLEAEAKTEKEKAEAQAAIERARLARAEASLKELELTRARFQLALDMVESMFPDAEGAEKMQMVSQLMPELARLTANVEIRPGGTGAFLLPTRTTR